MQLFLLSNFKCQNTFVHTNGLAVKPDEWVRDARRKRPITVFLKTDGGDGADCLNAEKRNDKEEEYMNRAEIGMRSNLVERDTPLHQMRRLWRRRIGWRRNPQDNSQLSIFTDNLTGNKEDDGH